MLIWIPRITRWILSILLLYLIYSETGVWTVALLTAMVLRQEIYTFRLFREKDKNFNL